MEYEIKAAGRLLIEKRRQELKKNNLVYIDELEDDPNLEIDDEEEMEMDISENPINGINPNNFNGILS